MNQVRQEFHITFRSSASSVEVKFAISGEAVQRQFDIVNDPGDVRRYASRIPNRLVEPCHLC